MSVLFFIDCGWVLFGGRVAGLGAYFLYYSTRAYEGVRALTLDQSAWDRDWEQDNDL